MSKKHFVKIADAIKAHNRSFAGTVHKYQVFTGKQLETLCDAFAEMNPRFKRQRFLDYIAS